ncbi:hypothetical protein TRFO_36713 [Tritrichomonas foetus]|uniref:Leucine Rich Repeat family protein n=1 Tax=Tritrichomonas foetus TaxID=1144522 RepID=A0A1J4JHZ7_9EUKA|nr:hypothetical protein TRFO_36713 [Tritrichomonas foetus]|eukprot:OHS97133.1 hypothetical protein TRFO_36713 [Tritrichomonas foetus]
MIDRKHYWRDVSSFNFVDEKIELYFEKTPFRFFSPDAEKIAGKLMEIFLRSFSADELAPLDLNRFAHPPITVNGVGIQNRLSILINSSKNFKMPEFRKTLKQALQYNSPSLELKEGDQVAENKNLAIVLETLRAIPYLKVIKLPKFNETEKLYQSLAEFVQKPSNVKMIQFENKADKNFKLFSDSLIKSTNSQINAITFNNVEFSDDEFENVQKIAEKKENINSLSFLNSFTHHNFGIFASSLISSELANKITYLNLDKTDKLDLSLIINKLPKISVLSLAGCKLEISDALSLIAGSKMKGLRYLNLSKNKLTRPCDDVQLPLYLERVDVNHVKWENNTLPSFIQILFNQKLNNGLRLFCNGADVGEDGWEPVFEAFESLNKYPLLEFSWSKNKVDDKLFNYLEKNENLDTLFFNQVFSEDKEEEIVNFSRILPSLTKLTHIVLQGKEDENELKEKVTIIFDALEKSPGLRYVDVSNNGLGNDGLKKLNDLIDNCATLTHVSFDNSKIDSMDSFNSLISSGEARRKPLFIDWPEHDIDRLQKAKTIDNDGLHELKVKLHQLCTGISNAKASAIRRASINADHGINITGSLKVKKNHRSKSPSSSKGKRGSVRDIRGGSFRGAPRPNLLLPDHSPLDIDQDSPLNELIETYKSTFTSKFPEYMTEELTNKFSLNPIPLVESESDSENQQSSEYEEDNEVKEENLEEQIKTREIVIDEKKDKKKKKTKLVIIGEEEEQDEENSEVIELTLLKDPDIPFIPQLTFPKDVYKYITPHGLPKLEQLKLSSNSHLKPLDLPKLHLLGRAPPILPVKVTKQQPIPEDLNADDVEGKPVDKSSMMLNEETNELQIIKSHMKTEELSDFSSSMSDEDESFDDLFVGEFPKLSKHVSHDDEENDDNNFNNKSGSSTDDEDGDHLLPEELPLGWVYEPPAWGFPIKRPTRATNRDYVEEMSEELSLEQLVYDLNKAMDEE